MMKDIATSIKATLYERIASPLTGSFLISWALWNYKILIVLFSSASPLKTIQYIEQTLSIREGLFYPLITSLTYVFVYPYPAKWVYSYWKKRQKELREIQQQIDNQTPLTVEESIVIKKEALALETKYIQEIQRRDNEIKALNVEVSDLKNDINNASAERNESNAAFKKSLEEKDEVIQQLQSELIAARNKQHEETAQSQKLLADEQLEILRMFLKTKYLSKTDIKPRVKYDQIRLEYHLNTLEHNRYISHDSAYRYYLTDSGKAFLVNKGIV